MLYFCVYIHIAYANKIGCPGVRLCYLSSPALTKFKNILQIHWADFLQPNLAQSIPG